MTRISASGELLGYVASITLTLLRLHNLLEREVALLAELKRRRRARAEKAEVDDGKDDILVAEIKQLRTRRVLRTLGLAQDIADAFLALADLRGNVSGSSNNSLFSSKSLLAIAGLVSGCISAYKNWP